MRKYCHSHHVLWTCYVMWEINLCMYSCEELFLHSLKCYFCVYFLSYLATQEINKITLSWALEEFCTWVLTLFSIYISWHQTSSPSSACANLIAMDLITIKGRTGQDCVSAIEFIIFHAWYVRRTSTVTSFLCASKICSIKTVCFGNTSTLGHNASLSLDESRNFNKKL